MSEDVLRRVRALLAKAEDAAATPEEAETYSRKAEELIAKHAIDTALLEAKDSTSKPTLRKYEAQRPYGKPKVALANAIAKAVGARVVMHSDKSFVVIGFQSDLDIVDMLYTSLLMQGLNASLQQGGDRAYRTAFWYGFAGRVGERLREQRRQATEESGVPGTEIVLADRKSEVDAAVAAEYPRLRTSNSSRLSSRAGLDAGRAAGSRANIGQSGLSGSRRAIA